MVITIKCLLRKPCKPQQNPFHWKNPDQRKNHIHCMLWHLFCGLGLCEPRYGIYFVGLDYVNHAMAFIL